MRRLAAWQARWRRAARHRPLRLVQLSDLHLLGDPAVRVRGLDAEATWRATRAAAQDACRRADLLLLTGDLAEHGEAAAYARLRRQLAHLGRPVVAIPGNHDRPAELARHFPSTGARRRRELALGSWRLLLLDTSVPGRSAGRLRRDQLAWLRARLAGRRTAYALVVMHHPPLPLGSAWIDAIGLENGGEARGVLAGGQADGVLFGHVHQVFDRPRQGVRYLAAPSTGTQFRPGTRHHENDVLPPGWRELALYPDGRLRSRVARVP